MTSPTNRTDEVDEPEFIRKCHYCGGELITYRSPINRIECADCCATIRQTPTQEWV